jgi:hypothetical protein
MTVIDARLTQAVLSKHAVTKSIFIGGADERQMQSANGDDAYARYYM